MTTTPPKLRHALAASLQFLLTESKLKHRFSIFTHVPLPHGFGGVVVGEEVGIAVVVGGFVGHGAKIQIYLISLFDLIHIIFIQDDQIFHEAIIPPPPWMNRGLFMHLLALVGLTPPPNFWPRPKFTLGSPCDVAC